MYGMKDNNQSELLPVNVPDCDALPDYLHTGLFVPTHCVFVPSLVRGAPESSESGTRERLIMTNHTHNATPSHHQQLSSSHPNTPPLTPPGDLPLNTTAAHMCSHISSTQTRAHTPALTYFQSPGKNVDSSLNPCQGP